jgi:predicted thioesterase
MIGVMENTATRLVAPYLEHGAATVGFEVCIKHVAAVLEAGSCVCRARLEEIVDGRKLRFAVEVLSADGRTVGVGTHERRIIGGRHS